MDLEQWAIENNLPVTDYVKIQSNRLRVLDDKCEICMKGAKMLCSGWRPFLNEDTSLQYGQVRVNNGACIKLHEDLQRQTIDRYLKTSQLPFEVVSSAITTYKAHESISTFKITDDCLEFGTERIPLRAVVGASIATTELLQYMIVCGVIHGYKAKRLYPQQLLLKYKQWDHLYDDFVVNCDWLVVERLDLAIGPNFEKDRIRDAIRQRITEQRPTVVTLGNKPMCRTEDEKELLEEVQQWEIMPIEKLQDILPA